MNNLINYYKGWPYSGHYYNTMNNIYSLLYNYLLNFPKTGKKYTVIFDIDDTLVYTDHANLFPNKKFPNKWILHKHVKFLIVGRYLQGPLKRH